MNFVNEKQIIINVCEKLWFIKWLSQKYLMNDKLSTETSLKHLYYFLLYGKNQYIYMNRLIHLFAHNCGTVIVGSFKMATIFYFMHIFMLKMHNKYLFINLFIPICTIIGKLRISNTHRVYIYSLIYFS